MISDVVIIKITDILDCAFVSYDRISDNRSGNSNRQLKVMIFQG